VLVARFGGGGNACGENFPGFFLASLPGQELAIHLITRNVVRIALDERAKVLIGCGRVAVIYAFESEAVEGEGVVRLLGHKFFERLAAGFLLFGHGIVPYYTGTRESIQTRQEARIRMKRKNEEIHHDEMKLVGKPVSASRSEMTEIVLPAQTNPLGKLLGGQVMHLVDMAAAMAAHRHSNSYVVTASVDYIDFRNAVNLGEIVILKSQVNRVFHTSMEVGVEVYSENVLTGEKKHTTTAYVTFVAIDEHTRKPKLVPPLILKTAEERRRYREAAKRRETRLALRYGEK
jgi:acyl-CoA hydrolase